MEEAARVFRDVFGKKSDNYRDLLQHLATSATTSGDKAMWQKHARDIAEELAGGDADFAVETKSRDGSERAKTSRTTAGATQTTVTEHTRTETTHGVAGGGPAHALPGHGESSVQSAHAAAHAAAHEAHLKAHEAHLKGHEAAVRAAQLTAGMGALGGHGGARQINSQLLAGMTAHEAHLKAHEAAVRAAQVSAGMGALGRSDL